MPDKFEGLRKAVRVGYQVSTDEIRALLEAYDALAKPDPKVPLLEAFKAGKKILRSYKWAVDWTGQANVGWEECPNDGKGLWLNFDLYEYRIEEPAPQQAGPVAWVDVHDRDEGPYEFHGRKLLPAGQHELFLHPPAAEVQRLREAAYNAIKAFDQGLHGADEIDALRRALEGK